MAGQDGARDGLIGGCWRVDARRKLPGVAGGMSAFVALDERNQIEAMAVLVSRQAPARAMVLGSASAKLPGMLAPLAFGAAPGPDSADSGYVICALPPGPALAEGLRPWSDAALIEQVLKPVALALEALRQAGFTHRAIRPNNVFAAAPNEIGAGVVLGCAWAAPAGMHQPSVFEPPGSIACAAAGRGDGSIADDVYALGVLLITLALGRVPLTGLDDEAVLRRKLDLGCHAALTEGERLSPLILDLTRGMLAEDPDHRPMPALLADPAAARTRRLAARKSRRAQRGMELDGEVAWHATGAARLLARHPAASVQALRGGAVETWLRRGLGDAGLAMRIEDLVRNAAQAEAGPAADALLAMRAVAVLDPLAPLCWRGLCFYPDGLGALMAEGRRDEALVELVSAEAIASWAAIRAERCDAVLHRMDARRYRTLARAPSSQGGRAAETLHRLLYALNPAQPCDGLPRQVGAWVTRLADLLPALERMASGGDGPAGGLQDPHLAAFIAERLERSGMAQPRGLEDATSPAGAALAQLQIFAQLQERFGPQSVPGLAGWMAAAARPAMALWPNLARRQVVERALPALVGAGGLGALSRLLDDARADARDHERLAEIRHVVQGIDAELARIVAGAGARARQAETLGAGVAARLGAVALAGALLFAWL